MPQNSSHETVTLDTPLVRGETMITTISVRKPSSGELRGLSLTDLLQLKVDSLCAVLPRISMPSITRTEVERLEPSDLLQLGTAVINFLLPKADRTETPPAETSYSLNS